MKHLFIVNPHSGHKRRQKQAVALLKKYPAGDYDIAYTKGPGHATELARAAVEKGIAYITAIGGDGTVNETASGVVNSASAFGIIPTGSGNGFARSLGIPLNLQAALDTVFKQNTKKADVGLVNGFYFFTTAGVGFDAVISDFFQSNHFRGFLPYFYYGVQTFFRYDYPAYTVYTDDKKLDINPLTIAFANGREYGNGAQIAPMARCDDGLLDLCVIDRLGIKDGLTGVLAMFNGRLDGKKFYRHIAGTNFTLESASGDILFHTDGEPRKSEKPLEVSILPHALNVIINR